MVGILTEEEAEIMEEDSIMLTRNLLRIAIYNITYIRQLFPDDCFCDMLVPEIGMNIMKLTPRTSESKRLIDWLEQGVSDALKSKYLKTLKLLICEKEGGETIEEYLFSFTYPDLNHNDVTISLSRTGSNNVGTTFKSNASKATHDQMRISACRMIRTVVSLVHALDQLPDERMIQMELLYYEDVTPDYYEPPLFKTCVNDVGSNKPFKMGVRNADSKHLVLAMKINSLLDPYILGNDNPTNAETIFENVCKQHESLSFSEAKLVKRFELCCISKRAPRFHLDSGASFHICNNKAYMKNLRPIPLEEQIEFTTADGKIFIPEEMGTLHFQNINLSQVYFIPTVQFNVISVGQLDEDGLLTSVAGGLFLIIDVHNCLVVGEGYKDIKNNDYVFRSINWIKPDQDLLFQDIDPDATDSDKDKAYEVNPEDTSDEEQSKGDEDHDYWIIDSCAAVHLTGRKDILTNIRSWKQDYNGPKSTISCTHSGTVRTEKLHLLKVLYSQASTRNILSVPVLDGECYRFTFYGGKCGIVCKGTLKECGSGIRNKRNNLYYLSEFHPDKDIPNTKRKR